MFFKKSIIDFLFKNKEIDQSSARLKPLLKEIEKKMEDEEKVFQTNTNESLSLQEYSIDTILERYNYLVSEISKNTTKLDDDIREGLVKLNLRILEVTETTKQALLSERKLTGESYTLQVPIEKFYSDNTTAVIEEGVIFGTGFEEENVKVKVDLSTLFIEAEENTTFKIVSNKDRYPITLNFSENFYKPFNQLKMSSGALSQTGILFVGFKKPEAISILNSEGYEIVPVKIVEKIAIPINAQSRDFSIRFSNNKNRQVTIEEIFFTETMYNKTSIYETMPLAVNKALSFLTVQTCDNYSNEAVDIQYEISINSNPYKAIRPNGKISTKKLESIIKTSIVDSKEAELKVTTLQDGYYRFYNEDLISINSKLKVFSEKMSKDFLSLENFSTEDVFKIKVFVEKPFELVLSEGMFIKIDGIKYEAKKKDFIKIERGFRDIEVSREYWKEIVDLDKYEILEVRKDMVIVCKRGDKNKEKIEIENDYDFNSKFTNSVYLQMWENKVVVFLKEEFDIKRKLDKDYIEYFYKESPKTIYIYSEAYQTNVESIQIRVTLKSEDQRVCPFISKMLVRGV